MFTHKKLTNLPTMYKSTLVKFKLSLIAPPPPPPPPNLPNTHTHTHTPVSIMLGKRWVLDADLKEEADWENLIISFGSEFQGVGAMLRVGIFTIWLNRAQCAERLLLNKDKYVIHNNCVIVVNNYILLVLPLILNKILSSKAMHILTHLYYKTAHSDSNMLQNVTTTSTKQYVKFWSKIISWQH